MGPDGGRTKVVEDGGVPISMGLKRRDPHKSDKCIYNEDCMVDVKNDCGVMNTCYSITCNKCPEETAEVTAPNPKQRARVTAGSRRKTSNKISAKQNYIGTSGRSMHARSLDHMTAINKLDSKNAMARHIMEKHSEDIDKPTFTMKPLSNHLHTLNRYTAESIYIEKQIQHLSMNGKTEWGRGKSIRIDIKTTRT